MSRPRKYNTEKERASAKKEHAKRSNRKHYKKYYAKRCLLRKTDKRVFLYGVYGNMRNRVTGKVKKAIHLYKGLPLLDWLDFRVWAIYDKEFDRLFKVWVSSANLLKLCPSINRIDSLKGYTIDNMEWLTHSENSRLGALSRHHGGSIR